MYVGVLCNIHGAPRIYVLPHNYAYIGPYAYGISRTRMGQYDACHRIFCPPKYECMDNCVPAL